MRNFNKNYSLVRVINAILDSAGIDVYLNGESLSNDLKFTEFSPYVYVPKGKYLLEVYPKDDKINLLFSKEIIIKEDELISLALTGEIENIELIEIEEDKEVPQNPYAKIRFVHLVPNGREINILLNDKTRAYNVSYKDVTPYFDIEPGIYDTEIEVSKNNQLVRRMQIKLNPYKIYTFYAMGNSPNFQIFQSVDGAVFMK